MRGSGLDWVVRREGDGARVMMRTLVRLDETLGVSLPEFVERDQI